MINFNRDMFSRRKFNFNLLVLVLCAGIGGCNSSDNGTDDGGFATLTGQAFFPSQIVASKTAVANAPFQVVDFERSVDKQVVATGTTDENGVYSAVVVQSKVVAVVVSGAVRVSGLITSDPNEVGKDLDIGKDFNGITDVACEAGANSIADGSVNPDDFDDARINNLEAGSALVNKTTDIDFFNPASVTAAAELVRQITDNGEHGPE